MIPNSPAISVIVPCYNVEKYLNMCLNSLKLQTFTDFEVLVIDDGSTDSSGIIAKKFAENNQNFKYYLIENGGPGGARNFGINKAVGEYLAFVDSDDRVAVDYLEKLYTCAKNSNADMVCCNYVKYYENKGRNHIIRFRKQKKGVYSSFQMKKLLLNDFTVRSYSWNKLCHKSLFTDNNIRFPNMYFEDIVTTFRLAHFANKIVAIEDPLYFYTIRNNSIMTSSIVEKYNDYMKAYSICINLIEQTDGTEKYKFNIANLGKTVLFADLYCILKLHFEEKSFKGLFANFYYCIRTIATNNNLGQHSFDDFPDVPYPIKHPEYFKNRNFSSNLTYSYTENETSTAFSEFEASSEIEKSKKIKKKKKEKQSVAN